MNPVSMPSFVRSVYDQEEVAKFLATTSGDGKPNVALIVSQIPVEPDRLVFGEFMMVKTRKNLDENPPGGKPGSDREIGDGRAKG